MCYKNSGEKNCHREFEQKESKIRFFHDKKTVQSNVIEVNFISLMSDKVIAMESWYIEINMKLAFSRFSYFFTIFRN